MRNNRLSAEEITIKYFGGEPKWEKPTKELTENDQLLKMLNWYSYNYEHKDAKRFVLAYMKSKNLPINGIETLGDQAFRTTAGWVARILILGAPGISNKPENYLNKHIAQLRELYSDTVKEQEEKERNKTQKLDIQKILEIQLNTYIAAIEGEIDTFIAGKFKSEFSLKDWLAGGNVKAIQAKRIAEIYEGKIKELVEAKNKTDPQCVEAYSHWSKKELAAVVTFYELLIKDAWDWHGCAKQIGKFNRKPRTRRVKPPEQQVAKLKYQRKDDTIGLTSIEPKRIVGASQIWVYNTKYRMLGVYNAANDHGFYVRGSTIQNFDESTSQEKKLRKPETILPKFKDGGKVALRKMLEFVRCKEKALTGRFNENTIIVKVF